MGGKSEERFAYKDNQFKCEVIGLLQISNCVVKLESSNVASIFFYAHHSCKCLL